MFTGIISQRGRVVGLEPARGGARLRIAPERALDDLAIGESIASSGVCLTVEPQSSPAELLFFLSSETLDRSSLGDLRKGDSVNLERALRADDRLGGHLVMGHVDGVGTIRALERDGEAWRLVVAYPAGLAPFLAPKGSVAVDGISLTVVDLTPETFSVAVIPHTVEATTLRGAAPGRHVNLEADMLARYVVRAMEVLGSQPGGPAGGLTREKLLQAGFGH